VRRLACGEIRRESALAVAGAVEAVVAVQNRRVLVASGVGFDGLVGGRAVAVDGEEEVPASGVDEPELFDARSIAK